MDYFSLTPIKAFLGNVFSYMHICIYVHLRAFNKLASRCQFALANNISIYAQCSQLYFGLFIFLILNYCK